MQPTINRMFADLVDRLVAYMPEGDELAQEIEDSLEEVVAYTDRKEMVRALDNLAKNPNNSQERFWEVVHLLAKNLADEVSFFESVYWETPIRSVSIPLVELITLHPMFVVQVTAFIEKVDLDQSIGSAILSQYVLPERLVAPFIQVFLTEKPATVKIDFDDAIEATLEEGALTYDSVAPLDFLPEVSDFPT